MIYFVSMKVSFVLSCGLYSKTGKWVLSLNPDNVLNSGYVRKWKTWHCLENGQEIWCNRISYCKFDLKSLKLEIVGLVMFNKMLVIVFTIDIYSGYGPGSHKTQSFNLCPYLTLSVRNGPSVRFETNVPWIYRGLKFYASHLYWSPQKSKMNF